MNYFLISLLLLVSINCYEEENGILVLKDDNYKAAIKEFPNIIVKMYAPWCGHCQALQPEYIEAAKIAKEEKLPIRFAEIDLTVNEKTGEEENVEGYPTIKFYQNGQAKEYPGERKAEAIVTFIRKKLMGSVFKFTTLNEINEFVKKNRVVLLSTISDNEKAQKEYHASADSTTDNLNFIECLSAECKGKYKSLVIIREFNKETVDFPYKEITEETIASFIEWYSIEPASLITEATVERLFLHNKTILLFRDDEDKKQKELDSIMKKIGKEQLGKYHVVSMNAVGDDINQRASEYFFITEDEQPLIQILMIADEKETNYIMRNKVLTEETINQFIKDVNEGKIKKEPLSEPINPEKEGLITLVGRNFVKEVIESDKAMFVLFKTDSCDVCEEFTNSWNEIGQKYGDSEDVNFGVINMKNNEVYGLTFDKYPVMRLYLKNMKENPIEYTGSAVVLDIEEWMAWKLGWAKEPITKPKTDL